MKKLAALILAAVMILSLVGCAGGTKTSDETTTAETTAAQTTADSETDASNTPTTAANGTQWNWPALSDLKVGYSQADLSSQWRTVESDDMQKVADDRGYQIVIVNAEGDTEQQLSDVESLLAQGCNVIVITAIDADAIQPALDACKAKGVPVIMKSRGSNGVAGVDYVSFIASDFVKEGELAAQWIYDHCTKDGIETIKVAEIEGVIGGTDVRDRSGGFHSVADEKGNFEFVAQQSANWSRSEAQEIAANVIQSTGGDINAFYCQNDEMALGVTLACQAAGLKIGEDVYILGVDGMYETFDAIKAGTISATVTCTPKFADVVFDKIEAGIKGEALDAYYAIEDHQVDATNVDQYYDLGF